MLPYFINAPQHAAGKPAAFVLESCRMRWRASQTLRRLSDINCRPIRLGCALQNADILQTSCRHIAADFAPIELSFRFRRLRNAQFRSRFHRPADSRCLQSSNFKSAKVCKTPRIFPQAFPYFRATRAQSMRRIISMRRIAFWLWRRFARRFIKRGA